MNQYSIGKRFDFIFLDADMPKLNGIDTDKEINAIAPESIIILVKNHEQYSINTFDCNAFRYPLMINMNLNIGYAERYVSFSEIKKKQKSLLTNPSREKK